MSPDLVLGVVTTLLALLGAAVSLHPPDSLHDPRKWWVKGVYAIAFFTLGAIAIIFVIKQSKETATANAKLSGTLGSLSASSAEISRVTSLNTNLQEKLLGQTSQISQLAEESFRNITGANSFPYVAPQPAPYPGPVSLFVWDHGKYMLNGVSLKIESMDNPNPFTPAIDVGVLHNGWGRPLSTVIQPNPDAKSGEDIWTIEMYTQSDVFTEIVHFRKSADSKWWANKFWVQKTKFGPRKEKATPLAKLPVLRPNESISFTVYDSSQWSDGSKN